MKKRIYLSIDLKSFFASVECVKLKKDPFKTPIIVANTHQGNGAITLAVTPFLKNQGVKSRCRLYEIPKHIKYTLVYPDMETYKDYSKKIVSIYEEFVDKKDIHVYSIDECFLDITNYLSLYKKKPHELAKDILNKIKNDTGLSASCGIGPSIFLAKVAMDTQGKKSLNNIAYFENHEELNKIKKLSDIWGIGKGLQKKLATLKIYTVEDIINSNKDYLEKNLGLVGKKIWNNFHGIYTDTIESLNRAPKEKSISHSKYLLKDYNAPDTLPLIMQMCEKLEQRLLSENKLFYSINFKMTYNNLEIALNKTIPTNGFIKTATEIYNLIKNNLIQKKFIYPIRKIDINLLKLKEKTNVQLSIFDEDKTSKQNDAITQTIFDIKEKYGYSSITKATNLLDNNK